MVHLVVRAGLRSDGRGVDDLLGLEVGGVLQGEVHDRFADRDDPFARPAAERRRPLEQLDPLLSRMRGESDQDVLLALVVLVDRRA